MRIGIVTEFYYPTLGGIQEHVYHFALEAQKKNHQVEIITSRVGDVSAENAKGISPLPITWVGKSFPIFSNGSVARLTLGRKLGQHLQEVFDRNAFDVIHVHSPLNPTLPLLAIARSNTTTVGTFHTNFNGSFFLRVLNKTMKRYMDQLDGVIAVSKTAAGAITRYFDTQFRIIPNGIDVSQFSPDVPPLPEFNDGKFNLLWVGRMEPRNGLDRMIAAFVLACHQRDDLRLMVVGDGPLFKTYQAMIPSGLLDRVRFFGYLNVERPAVYSSAQLLCAPATISSFGITLLEGMAAGIPIIASDIAGFTDVMTHEKEGLLLDTADPIAFADAILKLARDRDLSKKLGQCGRETALTYSWPHVTDLVLDYYQEAIDKHKARKQCHSS